MTDTCLHSGKEILSSELCSLHKGHKHTHLLSTSRELLSRSSGALYYTCEKREFGLPVRVSVCEKHRTLQGHRYVAVSVSFPVAVINILWHKQLKGERVYFSSQFKSYTGEVKIAGV